MKHTPRSQAIDILCQWQESGSSVDQIKEQLTRPFADQRDNHLANALIFGVLRQRGWLDWVLSKFASHPLHKMKPLTLQALRVGLYQLIFMDRIPNSAAINETVKVIKKRRQPKWLSGFVNGVLRNILRAHENNSLQWSDMPLHAELSHPKWLIKRWQKHIGLEKTTEICRTNNTPAPLCLWVNTTKIDRHSLQQNLSQAKIIAVAGVFCQDALFINDHHGAIVDIPGFREGLFQVQDEIAQLIVELLGPFGDGPYLDCCAGLGGKTSVLAQKMPTNHSIIAVEPQLGRKTLLAENLHRLGFAKQVHIFSGDLDSFAGQTSRQFTGVLVDAPCSGSGVIRRHPDIRWNRSPADFLAFQKKQLAILTTAAQLTAPTGVLVYATCSMEPEENEEVVKSFLENHAGFQVEHAGGFLSATAKELVDADGFLRTMPGKKCSDGFFGVRLRRIS